MGRANLPDSLPGGCRTADAKAKTVSSQVDARALVPNSRCKSGSATGNSDVLSELSMAATATAAAPDNASTVDGLLATSAHG